MTRLEAGETYDELRGVAMECDVRLVEERSGVARIGATVAARYSGHSGPGLDAFVAAQGGVSTRAASDCKRTQVICGLGWSIERPVGCPSGRKCWPRLR